MKIYLIDSPQKLIIGQGLWIQYVPSEYAVAEQTIRTHLEEYKACGVDVSPLESILEMLTVREHPQ